MACADKCQRSAVPQGNGAHSYSNAGLICEEEHKNRIYGQVLGPEHSQFRYQCSGVLRAIVLRYLLRGLASHQHVEWSCGSCVLCSLSKHTFPETDRACF